MMIIRLPSSTGNCSTFPYSSKSLAKRSNNTSPCSLKRMERPLKEHICFYFCSFFQKSLGMFQLEVVIMIICLRSETDLLHDHFHRFRLLFLLALLLLIKEFLIISNSTNGGAAFGEISTRSSLDLQPSLMPEK